MRAKLLGVAALCLLSIGITSAANATTTGSYSGFVDATPTYTYFDLDNIFGLGANANLANQPISGTFTYDPTGATQACGASYCNYFGVIDTITATIEGHTITVSGSNSSELSLANNDPAFATEFSLLAVNNAVDIGVLVRTFSGQFSINALDPNSPNFSVLNPDQFIGQLFFTGSDSGFNFSITQFEVASPLPAALPLFATGLGALGVLGWRRKRKKLAAIAA